MTAPLPPDAVTALLADEHARAERLLNRVRIVVLLLLGSAAVAYAPALTPALTLVNLAVLGPMLAWTLVQQWIFHRAERVVPWLPMANALIDVSAISALQVGYGVAGLPRLAVHSPIFLAYFAVLAARPFTGSLRRATLVAAITATQSAAILLFFVGTARLTIAASPLALDANSVSLLDEGARLLLLLVAGGISAYATAWNERALTTALAAQVARDAEEHQLSLRLQEADKLAAVGTLAAATVHEVRNPLTAIMMLAQVLQRSELDAAQREDVDGILREAKRTTAFVNELLRLAQPRDEERRPIALGAVLRDAMATARPLMRDAHVDVELSVAESLPELWGSSSRLERVFLNLFFNAVQAMEGQERVKRLLVRGVSSNGTVTVDIEDTGPGIPDDARALLFDRFYTTKPLGKGTGLGLWISREIVAEHGGTIEAVRGEHGGACFRLRFPLREWEHRREEAPIALPSALPVPA